MRGIVLRGKVLHGIVTKPQEIDAIRAHMQTDVMGAGYVRLL